MRSFACPQATCTRVVFGSNLLASTQAEETRIATGSSFWRQVRSMDLDSISVLVADPDEASVYLSRFLTCSAEIERH